MSSTHEDLLLINKPRGMSSFDVIRELRKKLGVRKMGHAGTLDPLAEGLMIIGVGAGTKRLTELTGLDKVYQVEVELGEKTASGDKEGEVLLKVVVRPDDVSPERVREVLEGLIGEVELPVPVYSAVKRGGVPLYARARRGEEVLPPKRTMRVHSLTLLDVYPSAEGASLFLSIEMNVGSGVYVRSIAEEIGERLGLPSTVSRLVRTRIGDFVLADAQTLDEF